MEKYSNKNAEKKTEKGMNRTEFAEEYSIDTNKSSNVVNKPAKTEKQSNCHKQSNCR